MRNIIATAQLIVIVVIAINLVHYVRHSDANSAARLQVLQQLAAQPEQQECVLNLTPLPTT